MTQLSQPNISVLKIRQAMNDLLTGLSNTELTTTVSNLDELMAFDHKMTKKLAQAIQKIMATETDNIVSAIGKLKFESPNKIAVSNLSGIARTLKDINAQMVINNKLMKKLASKK